MCAKRVYRESISVFYAVLKMYISETLDDIDFLIRYPPSN